MFYIIYQIINTTNGKTYIGKHQTKDLRKTGGGGDGPQSGPDPQLC